VWRLSVTPSEAPGLVARAGAEAALYDWGGGLVWLLVAAGVDLRARLGVFAGHATRVRGAGEAPAFPPEPAALAALSAGLRAKFDPKGLFNPGLMGAV
jgi:glycolate oxidase FAD binding subunit